MIVNIIVNRYENGIGKPIELLILKACQSI